MEVADVEPFAQRLFGAGADGAQADLANLVGEGLAGPADVALKLGLDIVRRQGGVVGETGAGLFDGPAHPVHAGVGDQTTGAPHLVAEAAEPLFGRAVEAHLLAEELRIQAPALGEGGDAGVAAEGGAGGCLLLQGDLQVMAGDGLMQRQGGQFVERSLIELAGVDDIAAGRSLLE